MKAINNLKPHGGGDCPEYTFAGMLEALYQDPLWGSPMYVFTDAGPKDASDENIEEVKHLASAEEYGVTINFFTTGKCNNGNLCRWFVCEYNLQSGVFLVFCLFVAFHVSFLFLFCFCFVLFVFCIC